MKTLIESFIATLVGLNNLRLIATNGFLFRRRFIATTVHPRITQITPSLLQRRLHVSHIHEHVLDEGQLPHKLLELNLSQCAGGVRSTATQSVLSRDTVGVSWYVRETEVDYVFSVAGRPKNPRARARPI